MYALGRSRPIQVLIVDDEPDFRTMLRFSLARVPDIAICGEVANGAEAIEFLWGNLSPDVVLLDVRMPGLDGVETARRIKRLCPQTKIVVLSAHPSALREIPEADWYLEKLGSPTKSINEAIHELCG